FCFFFFFFFFSSRRRHTRFDCDWSSDVCSSDLLLALISAPGMCGADFAMKVTDKNYLDTQGFSVFLYDSTYHPIFVDQKNTAMRSEERRVGKECRYGWEREQ